MSVSFISLSRSSLRSCKTLSASLSVHSERLKEDKKENQSLPYLAYHALVIQEASLTIGPGLQALDILTYNVGPLDPALYMVTS